MPELLDPATKTVLIVDDDESVLNLLEILVRRDGFKVELAENGDVALDKLKLGPDALLLDLMLPGTTTGFEVLRRMKIFERPAPPTSYLLLRRPDSQESPGRPERRRGPAQAGESGAAARRPSQGARHQGSRAQEARVAGQRQEGVRSDPG
ncbi:MAG: response regulator [Elusimicrobia bacterium]|nr:response regulator [Elusimicrobiota bacterium]